MSSMPIWRSSISEGAAGPETLKQRTSAIFTSEPPRSIAVPVVQVADALGAGDAAIEVVPDEVVSTRHALQGQDPAGLLRTPRARGAARIGSERHVTAIGSAGSSIVHKTSRTRSWIG